MKRVLAAILAVSVVFSITACSNNGANSSTSSVTGTSDAATGDTTDTAESSEDEGMDEYTIESGKIYNEVLGEFKTAYDEALAQTNISKRYALMAVAEAKMLETGIFMPCKSLGGRYAMSRVVPYTSSPVLWGTDDYRRKFTVVTNELITAEDRTAMKEKYKELKGTGTFREWVLGYLEENGYTLKDSYNYVYSTDMTTWDDLANSETDNSEMLVNTYDRLLEYDGEGTAQPCLAESYEVSADGLTYTFKIREGVKWVDSQGREVAELTADDFVAGFQHMMDAKAGLEYLVDGTIKGAHDYIAGNTTDMSAVGVSAPDDYTLVYTLEKVAPYFPTMLTYGVFAPLSRSYYTSQGGKFGAEFDASAADYKYGKDQNTIAYCGPYIVTNYTASNSIVFKKNESYWDKDNVSLNSVTYTYSDGSDPTKYYNDCLDGKLDLSAIDDTTLGAAKSTDSGDGTSIFDKYHYIGATDGTTFNGFMNLNRQVYANTNDTTRMVSPKTDEQKEATKQAMLNQHFRLALCFAIDRGTQNGQLTGEEIKYNAIRNSYTPGTFVSLAEDTTIAINGTDTTFSAGTNYGVIVQAQLDADGVPIKAYDPNGDDGVGSSDGFDGWYNPENAKAELEKAIEELKAEGLEISKENPIYIDLPVAAQVQQFLAGANVVKQSVESALDGCVVINVIEGTSYEDRSYASFYPETGAGMNYDYSDSAGWGPDYGDPSSYLDTLLPDYAGACTKYIGVF